MAITSFPSSFFEESALKISFGVVDLATIAVSAPSSLPATPMTSL